MTTELIHLKNNAVSDHGNAESNAFSGDDERLTELLEAWTDLPDSVKDVVLGLVKGPEPT